MNAMASYCSSSSDCTRRSSTQNDNTRDQKSQMRPYPDIINHNMDVSIRSNSNSPQIPSGISCKQTNPQYAVVEKKSSRKSKSNLNEQLVSIVKHKDPIKVSGSSHYPPQAQLQPEFTYQKIHPSTQQFPRPNNETNPSIIKAPSKVDIIKTTYPDL